MNTTPSHYPVILSLLATLEAAGFTLNRIHFPDGGKARPKSSDAAAKEVAGAYQSEMEFRPTGKPTENPFYVVVYTDNDPGEIVNDYTSRATEYGATFEATIQAWSEKWEGRPTPQEGCPLFFLAYNVLKFQNHVHPHVLKLAKEALGIPQTTTKESLGLPV